MPNRQKQVLFCSAGLLSLCCALSAAVVTGLPYWLRGVVLCRTGAELVNATGAELDQFLGELSYGLFHGERVKQCGLGGRPSRFSFKPTWHLAKANAKALNSATLMSTMRQRHNVVSVVCVTSCLVLILFASEVKIHRLSELISNYREENFVFQTHSERYDRCFWIFFLILILHGLNLVLIRLTGIQFPFQGKKDVELSGGAADLMY
ncbi:clarin-1 [Poecilia reticulata]|uniref:clarin-1 n=1 Tax=Poecilia reticulata TaxID=8081 RepID=UPI0007EACBA5|nr:PREDICTED: clarin-1-like [Poecilia reticulata]